MSIAAVSWGLGLGVLGEYHQLRQNKMAKNQPRGFHMCIIPDKLMFIVYLLDK